MEKGVLLKLMTRKSFRDDFNTIFSSWNCILKFHTIEQNKAFLLLEVLLTVVLVSASIVFINHAFSSSLKAISLTNSYQKAVLFLDEGIFDIELGTHLSGISNFSKEEVFWGTLFLWEQEVLPLKKSDLDDEYDAEDLGIERLECSVSWDINERRKIKLLTYVPVMES
jgi:hypothetical protein